MSLATGMALFFSAGAVCTDLFLEKCPTRWIALGLAAEADVRDSYTVPGMPVYLGRGYFLPAALLFAVHFRNDGAGVILLFMAVMERFLGSSGIIKRYVLHLSSGRCTFFGISLFPANLQERFFIFSII